MNSRPTTAAWLPGGIVGGFAGFAAHAAAPGTFPDWIWVPWAVAGMLAPYAWLHREHVPAKLTTVFVISLAVAAPLLGPVFAVGIGLAAVAAFLIADA